MEGCKVCTPHSWVEEGASSTCARYALVKSLRQQVEELQEEVRRLCCVREGEQEIDNNYLRCCKKKYLGPVALTSKDYQRAPTANSAVDKEVLWSLVTAGNRISLPPISSYVPTGKRI